MSDLLSMLGLGAAGLQAQHGGAAVAANNAANVNTRGYSRQRVDLRANPGPPLGGVSSGSPRRMSSELLIGRERLSYGASGRSSARAPALHDLEAAMASGGPRIDDNLGKLWAGLQRVAAMPTDSLVRDAAVAAARALADSIRERAEAVEQARADSNARIRDGVDQATALAREIADANKQIQITDDPVARDRRDNAAADLAALVGGEGRIDADGQMRWVLPDGGVLVDGDRASSFEATPDAVTGFYKVELVAPGGGQRRDVTASLDGGAVGGELSFRDVDSAKTASQLDQFAFDLTTAFNAAHRNGAGQDGIGGRNLFVPQAGVAGAASRIVVDAAIDSDPRRLAAGTVGAGPGDNQGVLGMLALRDQLVAGGGTRTLGDAAIDLTADVGREAAAAEAASARDGEVAEHLAGLRDSIAGVDLDEELAKMVHFQHASEAMTRFISTIDGMLGDLLQRL